MLLRLSMCTRPYRPSRRAQLRGGARRPGARRTFRTLSARTRAPTKQMDPYRRPAAWLLGGGGLDVLRDHVRIRGEPVRHLLELAALDLPDLHEPAALVVVRRDLERGHEPAEGEVVDLLEARLHVGAGDLAVRLGLEGIADGLDVQRGDQH